MSLQPQNFEDPLSNESQLRALLKLGIPVSGLAPEVQDYWKSRSRDAQQATASPDNQYEQAEQGALQSQQVLDEGDGPQVDDAPDLSSPSEWPSFDMFAPFASIPSDASGIPLGSSEESSSNTTVCSPEYVNESCDGMSEALPPNSDDEFCATQSTRPVRFNVSSDARLSAADLRRAPGAMTFRCPYYPLCESKFTRRNAIQAHMKLHDDEKSCACKLPGCDFRTKTDKLLRSHVQHVHEKKGEQVDAGH